jgi:hypothetical protein
MNGQTKMAEAFPLQWPVGKPRTSGRRKSRFDRDRGFGRTRDELLQELARLGATDLVLSTNIPLRRDGLPYADAREPQDPGVAVYFRRAGRPFVMACDGYVTVRENLRALALTVEALRTMDRHGAGQLLEDAFTGFAALPPPRPADPPWNEVLGVPAGCGLEKARAAFKDLAFKSHPDRAGGDRERFQQVCRAWERAEELFGG